MTPTMPPNDVIEELLRDAGITGERELTTVLHELRNQSIGPAPLPSAAISALMCEQSVKPRTSTSWAHRRTLAIALAVTASLGMGVTAAAASPEVRGIVQNVATLLAHAFVLGHHSPSAPPHTPVTGTTHPSHRTSMFLPTVPGQTEIPRPSSAPGHANVVPALPVTEPTPKSLPNPAANSGEHQPAPRPSTTPTGRVVPPASSSNSNHG